MIFIDFNQLGGYPLKQPTLLKMQSTYYQILAALVAQLGIPETGNYILKGCEVVGPNITDGIMYIDGQFCTFSEAPGSLATKIKKIETTEDLPFKNGINLPVIKKRLAVVDATGVLLSDFIRQPIVVDPDYVHTDNNFTDTLLAKLNGIESGAQVNVQPDCNQTDNTADDYIKNFPKILKVLKYGDGYLGNFPSPSGASTTDTTTITFPDVGTDQYYAHAFLVSLSPIGAAGQDIVPVTTNSYTSTSFKLMAKEFDSTPKNVQCVYILYEKP